VKKGEGGRRRKKGATGGIDCADDLLGYGFLLGGMEGRKKKREGKGFRSKGKPTYCYMCGDNYHPQEKGKKKKRKKNQGPWSEAL